MNTVVSEKYNEAVEIINLLKSNGFQAYIVGGYVRDMLFQKHHIHFNEGTDMISDIDIVTSAKPCELMSIFNINQERKSVLVGKNFGVVIVHFKNHYFELATFRQEYGASDGRHPDNVSFADDPQKDIIRRDFTINGLLLDTTTNSILDYVDGEKDIRLKVLRFIGKPKERIIEDHLRLLRAVRFAAKYDLLIHPETTKAIRENAFYIHGVSKERILDEMTKILMDQNRGRGIKLLKDLNLLDKIFPKINQMIGLQQPKEYHPEGDVFEHTCLTLEFLGRNVSRELVWSAFLHDVGKVDTFSISPQGLPTFYGHDMVGVGVAEQILRELKADNYLINSVVEMVANHMRFRFVKEMKKSKLIRFIFRPTFTDEIKLHIADCMASNKKLDNYKFIKEAKERFEKETLKGTNDIPKLITGHDLIEMGLKPGPLFKEILKDTHDYLINAGIPLTLENRELALQFLKKKWGGKTSERS